MIKKIFFSCFIFLLMASIAVPIKSLAQESEEGTVLEEELAEETSEDATEENATTVEPEESPLEETTEDPADTVLEEPPAETEGTPTPVSDPVNSGLVYVTARLVSDDGVELTEDIAVDLVITSQSVNASSKIISLTSDNNFISQFQILKDNYIIEASYYSKNNVNINYKVSLENSIIRIEEDGQIITATLQPINQVVQEEPEEEQVVEEVKEENFWLKLLKNNIIFIVILLGLAIALFVYRYRRDNQ